MTGLPTTRSAPPGMARREFRNDDFFDNTPSPTKLSGRRDYSAVVSARQASGRGDDTCSTM